MTHTIQDAALLNQHGAAFLASNQPEQALKCFQTALQYVINPEDAHMLDTSCSHSSAQLLASTKLQDSDDDYIYDKPFFFNPAANMADEETGPFGAVILFNLALSYHEQAKLLGESHLKMAMQLYEKCLLLLREQNHFDCSNIIIAALHNQAKIFEHFYDHQLAAEKYSVLSALLEREEIRRDTLEQEDLNSICLDIYFFKFPTCAPVA